MLTHRSANDLEPTKIRGRFIVRLLRFGAWIAFLTFVQQQGGAQEIASRFTRNIKLSGRPRPLFLAISPDGEKISLAFSDGLSEGGVRLIDVTSGKEIRALKHEGDRYDDLLCTAFSPDGKTIALGGCRDGNSTLNVSIRFFDVATGDERFVLHTGWTQLKAVKFSPDGRTFAAGNMESDVVLWDLERKKVRAKLPKHEPGVCGLSFAPDGKTLATGVRFEDKIFIWDTTTAKRCFTLTTEEAEINHSWTPCFSPDGKLLAAAGSRGGLKMWDLRTRKGRGIFPAPDATEGIMDLTFSTDGRMLATASENFIQLWEVVTAKERATLRGQKRAISMAFSPDGRTLVSGSAYGILKVWDLDADKKKCPDADALSSLWIDLQSTDAPRAYKAIRILTTFPSQSLPFLARHLSPAVDPPDPPLDKLKVWIADLDSDTFAVRQNATIELKKSGIAAKATLNRAFKASPSLEARRRIEAILEQIELTRYVQELQQIRSVEILEHIGSTEACALLEEIAKGVPEARQTQEAKASLARLKKRPVAKR